MKVTCTVPTATTTTSRCQLAVDVHVHDRRDRRARRTDNSSEGSGSGATPSRRASIRTRTRGVREHGAAYAAVSSRCVPCTRTLGSVRPHAHSVATRDNGPRGPRALGIGSNTRARRSRGWRCVCPEFRGFRAVDVHVTRGRVRARSSNDTTPRSKGMWRFRFSRRPSSLQDRRTDRHPCEDAMPRRIHGRPQHRRGV